MQEVCLDKNRKKICRDYYFAGLNILDEMLVQLLIIFYICILTIFVIVRRYFKTGVVIFKGFRISISGVFDYAFWLMGKGFSKNGEYLNKVKI